jgi:hypothetical protein
LGCGTNSEMLIIILLTILAKPLSPPMPDMQEDIIPDIRGLNINQLCRTINNISVENILS